MTITRPIGKNSLKSTVKMYPLSLWWLPEGLWGGDWLKMVKEVRYVVMEGD